MNNEGTIRALLTDPTTSRVRVLGMVTRAMETLGNEDEKALATILDRAIESFCRNGRLAKSM